MPLQPHGTFHAPHEAKQSTLGAHLQMGSCDVQPMAASVVQLRQLHKGLHLLSPPTADDGCGEELCYLAHCLPHLQQAALFNTCHGGLCQPRPEPVCVQGHLLAGNESPELLAGCRVRQTKADPAEYAL